MNAFKSMMGNPLFSLAAATIITMVRPAGFSWWRISAHTLAMVGVGLICYVRIKLIRDKSTIHRQINLFALVFFGFRIILHGWIAFDFTFGVPHLPVFMSTFSAATELAFGFVYYAHRNEIALTYRRSEAVRMEFITKLESIASRANLLEEATRLNAKQSHVVSEMIANVGRGGG